METEYGVLRRTKEGRIVWATLYPDLDSARNNATPMDSVEQRQVGPWGPVQ